MAGGDDNSNRNLELVPFEISNEDLKKLLESDEEDVSDAIEHYNTGDPQFLELAYSDMRKLDVLLQRKFTEEARLRKKRKKHVQNIQQTLSKFQVSSDGRVEGRNETDNTKRFLSATDFEFVETDWAVAPTASTMTSAKNASTAENPIEQFIDGEPPRRITDEELEKCKDQWAVIPFEDEEEEHTKFEDEESNQSVQSETEPPPEKAVKFSYRFDTKPPPVDHVKRNIQRAGHYYTPDEKSRLDRLLSNPMEEIPLETDQAISVKSENPFQFLEGDLLTLKDIEATLQTIRKNSGNGGSDALSESHRSTFGSHAGNLQFGFYRNNPKQDEIDYKRIMEINERLHEIDMEEQHLLIKILGDEEVEPLASQENITEAICHAEKELMLTISEEIKENRELVPFVSENEIQMLLGPEPKTSHYSNSGLKNEKLTQAWSVWLNERQRLLLVLNEELAKDKVLQEELDREQVLSVDEMHAKFNSLMNEVKEVKLHLEELIGPEDVFSSANRVDEQPINVQ